MVNVQRKIQVNIISHAIRRDMSGVISMETQLCVWNTAQEHKDENPIHISTELGSFGLLRSE